jgi:predicted Co/Zn/Cd cation transporter (cation efflux family)
MTQIHTQCPKVQPETFNRRALLWLSLLFALMLAGSVLLGVVYHSHTKFTYDGAWWFYSAFGFGASVAMVVASKMLGFFLKRRTGYWEDKA